MVVVVGPLPPALELNTVVSATKHLRATTFGEWRLEVTKAEAFDIGEGPRQVARVGRGAQAELAVGTFLILILSSSPRAG